MGCSQNHYHWSALDAVAAAEAAAQGVLIRFFDKCYKLWSTSQVWHPGDFFLALSKNINVPLLIQGIFCLNFLFWHAAIHFWKNGAKWITYLPLLNDWIQHLEWSTLPHFWGLSFFKNYLMIHLAPRGAKWITRGFLKKRAPRGPKQIFFHTWF